MGNIMMCLDVLFLINLGIIFYLKYKWIIYKNKHTLQMTIYISIFISVVAQILFINFINSYWLIIFIRLSVITLFLFLTLGNPKPIINYYINLNNRYYMKYYYQGDKRWGKTKYGDYRGREGTMFKCGCFPTVLAMIHSCVNENITPVETATYLSKCKHNKTIVSTLSKYAELNNWNVYYLKREDACLLKNEFYNNRLVCITIPTRQGGAHSICAYSIDEKDNIMIADPFNIGNNRIKLNKLLKQVNRLPEHIEYPFISFDFNLV